MRISKIIMVFAAAAFFAMLLSGCLTVEKKIYTFELTGPHSGKLTIKYVNIMSQKDNDKNVSADDYKKLIDEYLNGTTMEGDYPDAKNFKKRLYEENGMLCGEITMEFEELDAVKLYQYDDNSPYMFDPKGSGSEKYIDSNGKYDEMKMPVVFWDKSARNINVTTQYAEVSKDMVSLLKLYQKDQK